jgi:hypothetical protein
MNLSQIQAIGYFFSNYYSDLTYIGNFKKFKKGKISLKNYSIKGDHTFYNFLSEFRVARGIGKNKSAKLLKFLIEWLKRDNRNSVDQLAKELKGKKLTHGKIMTSLASKILFLNDPYKILPIDNRVKKTVHQKSNSYSEYKKRLAKFIRLNKKQIDECSDNLRPFAVQLEKYFQNDIKNLEIIRRNRIIDKLLWTQRGL